MAMFPIAVNAQLMYMSDFGFIDNNVAIEN